MSDLGMFGGDAGFVWATGIEDTFIAQEEPGRLRLDEHELTQHYRLWREDVDLAASIGGGRTVEIDEAARHHLSRLRAER
jgi:hypothetical protein